MTATRTVLRRLGRRLAGNYQMCGRKLVLDPRDDIVRGFSLDSTGWKGTYFLLLIVVPLYRPQTRSLHITYCDRLKPDGGFEFDLGTQDPDIVTAQMLRTIEQGSWEAYLENMRGPLDFVAHVRKEWPQAGANSPEHIAFELGAAFVAAGEAEEAETILRNLVARKSDFESYEETRARAQQLLDLMQDDVGKAQAVIAGWVRENQEKFLADCVAVR